MAPKVGHLFSMIVLRLNRWYNSTECLLGTEE